MELSAQPGVLYPRWYDAQVAIVGSMLIDPRCVGEVLSLVSAEDFRYESFAKIFRVIRDMFNGGVVIDPVTVQDRLDEDCMQIMAEAMRITPTAANVLEYCKVLRDESDLYRLKEMAERILSAPTADMARHELTESLALAVKKTRWRRTEIREGLNNLLDRLSDPAPPQFIRWGMPVLDNNLRVKSNRGKFIVIGAESSVGKTAFALQLAFSMAATGKRVGFYSLETDEESAYDRVFVQRAKIRLRDLMCKKVSDAEIQRLSALGDELYRRPEIHMEIIESAGATVEEIRTDVLIHRFDVVLIDYVQLMRAKGEQRSTIVTNISMGLHTLAQELGITVVGLSQLTPPQESKRNPYRLNRKEDLRESKQLINDADAIMIMSRTREDEPNFRELVIDKNKTGPCGTVALDFFPEYMSFEEHANTKSEQYRNMMAAVSRAKKEAAGQVSLQELDDEEGGENPFPT